MKVIGVIPARIGSTRLPRKPLREIHGKTLIQYVYENAKRIKGLDDLIVACDSTEIEDAVQKFGGKAILTQTHHNSGTERLTEVAERLEADVYINIQGDEPLIDSTDIDRLIATMRSSNDEIATLCIPSENETEYKSPHTVKCVMNRAHYALYFSRSPIPHYLDRRNPVFFKHLGVYAYRRSVILKILSLDPSVLEAGEKLEQLRLLENGFRIKVVLAQHDSLGIDTEEDFTRFEAYVADRKKLKK